MHLLAFSLIDRVQSWMSEAGYPVLFLLLLSCGIIPLPEDIPLVLAGYFVAGGKMNLALAGVFAWCGIIGGDCILYYLGRRYGRAVTKWPMIGKHLSDERIDAAHNYFEKYGVLVVAVGRLFAGIRGAMVLTAGTIRFTFLHFIIADGLAAILSGGLFMALGYWGYKRFGDIHQIGAESDKYKNYMFLGAIVLVTGVVCWKLWKARRQKARLERPAAVTTTEPSPGETPA